MGRNQRISIVFFVKIIFLISIILILLMINSLTRYLLLVISTSLKSILQYPMSAQYHSFYFQYKYIWNPFDFELVFQSYQTTHIKFDLIPH